MSATILLGFVALLLSVEANPYGGYGGLNQPGLALLRPTVSNSKYRFEEVYRWKQMSYTPLDNGM